MTAKTSVRRIKPTLQAGLLEIGELSASRNLTERFGARSGNNS